MALVADLCGPPLARCLDCVSLLISPAVLQLWHERIKSYGPGISGALFGAGWWFWVDAVACTNDKVPFVQYIPGIIATLALVMINCVRRDELSDFDPFDEGVYCRSRFWLFISYVVSFGSIIGAVWVFLAGYATKPGVDTVWPGVAAIFQVCFILGSALALFVSRSPGGEGSAALYEPF